ncbi:MAG: BrnA antitoxin family protein [Roseateles sp.]|uniref:BrnA antitoxin family protein n=1 Tax=Roseateles sp. TaxID=1971397 RepID=UPI0039EC55E0
MNKRRTPESTDDDNPEWTTAEAQRAVPFSGLPATLQAKLRGRPKATVTKEPVKLRLDRDVLAALRATGDGWQTRVNDVLRANLALSGKLG